MSLNIQRPIGGPDVTRRNKRDFIYLKGDENTDGSIRWVKQADTETSFFQLRTAGTFNQTSVMVSGSGSLFLGRDLSIQSAADFIKTENPSIFGVHDVALIPHIPFLPSGTLFPHTPITDKIETEVFFSTPVSEIISTTISQAYVITFSQIVKDIIFESGSLAANSDIILKIFKGTDNTGQLIFEFNLAPSLFPSNSTIQLDFGSSFGFSENHTNIFIELSSVTSFSLKTDVGGNVITSFNTHRLEVRDLVYDDLPLANDLSLIFDNSLNFVYRNQFAA